MNNPAPADPVAQLLDEIIESVHPLMAEAFFCAALPHWYDLPLFTAIRAKDDERNEGLIPRLDKYSFILPLPDTDDTAFRTRDKERELLNKRWINQDAAAYVAAHEHAHNYWQNFQQIDPTTEQPISGESTVDEITSEQNELYHHYFVNLADASRELADLFRNYHSERLVAAIERLLHTADEARYYLNLLVEKSHNSGKGVPPIGNIPTDNSSATNEFTPNPADLANFDHLVEHLYARQAQLEGKWLESSAMFEALRSKPGLTPELVPFVARGYALSLKETGLYVESIGEYKLAIKLFKRLAKEQERRSALGPTEQAAETEQAQVEFLTSYSGLQTELGLTMLDLGEAYVDFALLANTDPSKESAHHGWWQRMQQFYEFLTSLPLVLYLSMYIGRRVWHPSFWRVLENLDWIVGRLFGKGADQYLRADKILDEYGNSSDAVLANEKLAYLYLKMGDFLQARNLFAELLERTPSPLSDYHRALVRRGLAEAELALREPRRARLFLQKSLPVLQAYGDEPEVAEARTLLAETMLAAAEPTQALDQFEQVLTYHQEAQNREKATNIYERLKAMLRSDLLDADETHRAQSLTELVTKRRYPVRFRSLTTIFTQRALLVFLSLFFVLMPLLIIELESRTEIAPEINFRVPPLLLKSGAEFKPDLSVGMTALNVTDTSEAELLLSLGALLFLFYLLFVTLMGVLAIISTPLHRMQKTMQAKAIDVDENGIRIGRETVTDIVPWQNVHKLLRSDMSMFSSKLRVDDSLIVLANSAFHAEGGEGGNAGTSEENDQVEPAMLVTIRGSTAWYTPLADWLATRVPNDPGQIALSYSWLRGWVGLLYGLGLLTVMFLAAYTSLPESTAVTIDLPLLHYSIFDLYPYLYFMLFVPPMLWFVFRPLRIRSYLTPRSLIPWAVGGAGLLLFAIRVTTQFRPWLTVPDIYPAGVILFLVVGAAATIWQARDPISNVSSFPLWSRGTAAFVALLVTVVMGTYVAREMVAYHYLVNGHHFRDQEQRLNRTPPVSLVIAKKSTSLLEDALAYYKESRRIAEYPLPWISQINTGTAQHRGFPKYDQTIWYAASKNVADIATKLDLSDIQPDKIYNTLLLHVDDEDKAELHISQALAMAARAGEPVTEFGDLQAREALSEAAIAKFTEAIAAIDKGKTDQEVADAKTEAEDDATKRRYKLWQGVARHAFYSPSDKGSTDDYEAIVNNYEQVIEEAEIQFETDAEINLLNNHSAEKALVGLGWLTYQREYQKVRLEQDFGETFEHFEKANLLNPQSAEALLGMGYVYYQQAEQAIEELRALGNPTSETAEAQGFMDDANGWLRKAEGIWLDAYAVSPYEPSIPISLATLHWKLANPIINNDTANRCDEYRQAVNILGSVLSPDGVRFQSSEEIAYSHRTRAQIRWLLQDIECPGVDRAAIIKQSIDDYSMAIMLDPKTAFYWHMRARLTGTLVGIQLTDEGGTLQNQRMLQTKIAPLLVHALQDMDQALTIDPRDDPDSAVDYRPNANLTLLTKQAFENGYALLSRSEPEDAMTVYTAAIEAAIKHGGQSKLVSEAAERLATRLANRPSPKGEEILRALQRTIVALGITDPVLAFADAAIQVSASDEENALNTYQRALRLAIDTDDIRSVEEALSDVYKQDDAPLESVIELFGEAFPQLTQVQQSNSNTDALNLAFIAAAVGKTPTSMYWYIEGIRRSTLQGTDVSMSNSEQAKRLSTTWENNGVQLQTMLNEIPKMISDQQFLYPELDQNGDYWRRIAWSIYFLGWQAFLQGDEEAATNALEVGQPYADRAAELGAATGDVVHTYYPEGAWSWYHFVRAEQKQDENDYRGALADYSLAVIVSRARTNETAIEERAQAAFRAGLMALLLDNEPLAITWYKQGLQHVVNDADKVAAMNSQLNTAITELQAAILAKPALATYGESILQTLQEATDAQ